MNVNWTEGTNSISWSEPTDVGIRLPDRVDSACAYESEPRVLALYGPDRWKLRLAAFDSSGRQVLDVPPPDGYHFHYLSKHINWEHAVVCIVSEEGYVAGEHNFDWFFAIDVQNKCLVSLNRAY